MCAYVHTCPCVHVCFLHTSWHRTHPSTVSWLCGWRCFHSHCHSSKHLPKHNCALTRLNKHGCLFARFSSVVWTVRPGPEL